MPRTSQFAPYVLLPFLLLTACEEASAPRDLPSDPGGSSSRVAGLVDITITGIGTDRPVATATMVGTDAPQAGLPERSDGPPETAAASAMTSRSLTVLPNGMQLDLASASVSTFTYGTRGSGGYRFISATFRVRNAENGSNSAYPDAHDNVTFIAVNDVTPGTGTIGGSAMTQLRRFDQSAASTAIAGQMFPTGHVGLSGDGVPVVLSVDVLQAYTEAEVAPLTSGNVNALPYGFVVRNPGRADDRVLPAILAADAFDGRVTFAYKFPLQATASEDPFTVSARFFVVGDNQDVVTESIEEEISGTEGAADRADALDASLRRVAADPACQLRIAGTAASPLRTFNGTNVVGRTPDPYSAAAFSIPAANPLSIDFSSALPGGGNEIFRVTGALTGRKFLAGGYAGTTTLTTAAPSFLPGEAVEVSVVRVPRDPTTTSNLCNSETYRYRAAAGEGSGVFLNASGPGSISSVAFADLDGDGDLDMAYTEAAFLKVSFRDGAGAYGTPVVRATGSATSARPVLADVDGDGDMDFLGITTSASPSVSVLLNNGAGTFTSVAGGPFSTAISIESFVLGDLDSDGDLDLLASGGSGARVMRGDGRGAFSVVGAAMATHYSSGAIGDVNEDGDLDILLSGSAGVDVYLGDGVLGFTLVGLAPIPFSSPTLQVVDLNGDGHLDVMAASGQQVRVAVGAGDGTFGSAGLAIPEGGNPLGIADMDGDGDSDVLLMEASFTSAGLNLWLNNGTGTFTESLFNPVLQAALFCNYDLAAADFNGDGLIDAHVNTPGCGTGYFATNFPAPAFVMQSVVAPSPTSIEVTFTQAPDGDQAQSAGNYSVTATSGAPSILAASLSGNVVTLTTSDQTGASSPAILHVAGVTRGTDGAPMVLSAKSFEPYVVFGIGTIQQVNATLVLVSFKGAPDPASVAADGSNFIITGGAGLTVSGASMSEGKVLLTTSPQQPGQLYTITVSGVSRLSDGETLSGSTKTYTAF